jgi:hypothetical protein
MAMNGGVVHAVEGLTADELARAIEGYRFFGLDEVADLVAHVARQASDVDPDDVDAAERLELESNERFYALVRDDEAVAEAFRAHFHEHPEAYAPVAGN